jgi:predicted oxidoreductase
VGTTSAKRLAQSISALDIPLERMDWFLLLEASMGEPLP